jgi:putative endonuclease
MDESFWRETALPDHAMKGLYEFADLLRQHARRRHMTEDHALGRQGEDIAQRFLQRAGIIVVDRNYRLASGAGEVDLVGWEGDTLVFVEVKSRQTDEHGSPDRAIGLQKQASLIRTARQYARQAEVPWHKVRFDVVNVVFATTPPAITHFRDVFGPNTPKL